MKAAARTRAGIPELPDESVTPIRNVTLAVSPEPWAFAALHEEKIARFWKKAAEENRSLHNGQIYFLTRWQIENNRFEGTLQPGSFASFLYWRDQGYPEAGARNCFGSSVIRSKDGHLLFGRMAAHTATAGLVYPAGGSFGPEDVRAGSMDVEFNIARELKEETGLAAAAAERWPGYLCVQEGPRISLAAVFNYSLPAAELRRKIIHYIETTEDPELDDIVVFRRRSFVRHHRMPAYARLLVEHLLPG